MSALPLLMLVFALSPALPLRAVPIPQPAAPLDQASFALRFAEDERALALAGRAADEDPLAAAYLEGRAALRLGELGRAESALRRVSDSDAPFRFGAQIHLSETLVRRGHGVSALALLNALPKSIRDGERRHELAILRGRALTAAARYEAAVEHFTGLERTWHQRLPEDEVLYELARAESKRRPERGADLFRRLLIDHPASPFLSHVAGDVAPPLTAAERRERALATYKAREYEDAVARLTKVVEENPDDLEVHLILGKLHGMVLRDDRAAAERHLSRVLEQTRKADQRGEAAFRLAHVLADLRRYDEALEAVRKARERGPGDWARSLAYREARLLHEAGRYAEAGPAFADYVRRHKPRDRTMYQWFVGWTAFRGGDYRKALAEFAKLTSHSNLLVGAKALYWSAVARERLGSPAKAVAALRELLRRFPLCYYAVLATRKLEALGKPTPLPGLDKKLPSPYDETDWTVFERRLPSRDVHDFRSLRRLVTVGDLAEARDMLERLAPSFERRLGRAQWPRWEPRLKDLAETPHTARYEAWRRNRSVLLSPPTRETAERWRAIYPRAYHRVAEAAAAREDVPELLLYCHMLQESRYKRFAVSSAPAYGVMQFLEKTARRVSAEIDMPYERVALFDPAVNIRLGAHYLAALLKRYRGQLPLAVAAYNGGPRLVDAHLARFGNLPFDELIEEIDRHETRNYVRKILDHYVRYVTLYLPPEQRQAAIDAAFPRTIDPEHGDHPSY